LVGANTEYEPWPLRVFTKSAAFIAFTGAVCFLEPIVTSTMSFEVCAIELIDDDSAAAKSVSFLIYFNNCFFIRLFLKLNLLICFIVI